MSFQENTPRPLLKSNAIANQIAVTRKAIPLRELLGGKNEALIEHNGQIYVLRLTKQGRVLLTK